MPRRLEALVALALVLLATLRLWWCGRFELSPDEAYYWLWSQRLDWAYFSKGPGIAAAIAFSTSLLGDSERGVRWLAPVLALGTTAAWWLLVRDTLSRAAATATAIALQCVPLFSVGALVMTIDALSVFTWSLALVFAWRAMTRDGFSLWWPACGLACGIGFLCKYTNLLVLAGIALAIAADPARRRALLDRRGATLALGFLPGLLPPILWNTQRGWPTAHHLFERGGLHREGPWLAPGETLEFVVVHFGTWSPLMFLGILLALPWIARRCRLDAGARFLALSALPVLAMYAVLALHEAGEPNWTGPGVLGLLPLAAAFWLERASASVPARAFVLAALSLGALLSLAIANTNLIRLAGIPLAARSDPSTRLRGWTDTARWVEAERARLDPDRASPVIAHHYGLASELAYYGSFAPLAEGQPEVSVLPSARPRNQFWFWPSPRDLRPPPDRALVVSDRRAPPPEDFAQSCALASEHDIAGPGGVLRTIRIHDCRGLGASPP